jgi:phosphatidylglycerol:prolipoprotein diacylglycerol transferase
MHRIPLLPFLDLIATYAPLLQSIARLGCFFAGCCFGCVTQVPWATLYTDSASLAPTGMMLHPAQLYSAFGLLLVFIIMYFVARKKCTIPGQQGALYLMLASGERFLTDFWRGDRETVNALTQYGIALSFHQLLALGIIMIAGILFFSVTYCGRRRII